MFTCIHLLYTIENYISHQHPREPPVLHCARKWVYVCYLLNPINKYVYSTMKFYNICICIYIYDIYIKSHRSCVCEWKSQRFLPKIKLPDGIFVLLLPLWDSFFLPCTQHNMFCSSQKCGNRQVMKPSYTGCNTRERLERQDIGESYLNISISSWILHHLHLAL
jgi:hypothetical protein